MRPFETQRYEHSRMIKKKPTVVAIYARVSRGEKQDVQNQLRELRAYCVRMHYKIYREYIDRESGAKGRNERTAFAQLFHDASKRHFDIVLFWALDRFTREGLQKTIFYLQQLDVAGVQFHSYTEQYLTTDNELVRDILISVLASLAKQERRRISERTKAGLETARKKGKQIGRPSKAHLQDHIKSLTQKGLSKNAIAKKLSIDYKTVLKYYPRKAIGK